ncbi:flavodoxin [Pantoea sp. B65]|uniref:flavodoxin n=1 Tax=Pantoea sp. B65 TaxID=2813359 RepID=UPI0039B437F4
MANIGIFFGSDTGQTRKVAKLIHQKLDGAADAPLDIRRATPEQFFAYPILLLGTPTLGNGELPGIDSGSQYDSWLEFVDTLTAADLSGKTVALFGLGDQVNYSANFVSAMRILYDIVIARGASVVGNWSREGYQFSFSAALLDDNEFVGLPLDQENQYDLTEERIDSWLEKIKMAVL